MGGPLPDGPQTVHPTAGGGAGGGGGLRVLCSGGLTVLQRRVDGAVDFERGWEEFQDGFGDTQGTNYLQMSVFIIFNAQTRIGRCAKEGWHKR